MKNNWKIDFKISNFFQVSIWGNHIGFISKDYCKQTNVIQIFCFQLLLLWIFIRIKVINIVWKKNILFPPSSSWWYSRAVTLGFNGQNSMHMFHICFLEKREKIWISFRESCNKVFLFRKLESQDFNFRIFFKHIFIIIIFPGKQEYSRETFILIKMFTKTFLHIIFSLFVFV